MADNSKMMIAAAVASVCTAPLVYLFSGGQNKSLQLEKDIQSLQHKSTQVQSHLQEARDKLVAAEKEIERLRKVTTDDASLKAKITKELEVKETTLQSLQGQLVTITQKGQNVEAEFTSVKEQLASLTLSDYEKNQTVERLNNELKTLQSNLTKLGSEHSALQEESTRSVSTLKAQAESLQKQLETTKEVLNQAESTVKSLEHEKQTLNLTYQDQVKSLNEHLKISSTTIQELKASLEFLNTEKSQTSKTLNELTLALSKEQEAKKASTSELEKQIESLTSQLKEFEVLRASDQTKFNELQTKYDVDHKRLAEMSINIITFVNGTPEQVESLKAKIKASRAKPTKDNH